MKKFREHLVVALSFFILTLGQQYLFYLLKGLPIIGLSFEKYLGLFLFFAAATFVKPFFLRWLFLSFIFLINFFQMVHLSYFGTLILPNEIYLFLTQFHEVEGTLINELRHVLIPFSFTFIPALGGYLLLKKYPPRYGTKIMPVIFGLYFIYNPIRTYFTGNTWGRQPTIRHLSGVNVYLSFSYFMGKILPHKMTQASSLEARNSSLDLTFKDEHDPIWDKIIVILGESLTPNNMELFGYHLPTTPFLVKMKEDQNFHYLRGLAAGVSTDIAVAFFLNQGFGDAGSLKAAKGEHCLFKLAKNRGFSTHFLSIQSAQQLRYITPYLCSSYLDDFRTLEDISPETEDHQAAKDRDLLPELQKLLAQKERQFILLHQRGSHAPWELRSTAESREFTDGSRISDYNNSVVEFDLFMRDFFNAVKKSSQKILVLYLSDHGEAVGENENWGHGFLIRYSFEIPILFYSHNETLPQVVKSFPSFFTQYNASLFITDEFGYRPSQPVEKLPQDYVIFGNDIDGFAGRARVLFKPDNTYDFERSF